MIQGLYLCRNYIEITKNRKLILFTHTWGKVKYTLFVHLNTVFYYIHDVIKVCFVDIIQFSAEFTPLCMDASQVKIFTDQMWILHNIFIMLVKFLVRKMSSFYSVIILKHWNLNFLQKCWNSELRLPCVVKRVKL